MNWVEVLVSWFPMLLLIAVWIFFMQRYGGLSGKGMTQPQYMEELLKETRRHNEALERLVATLSERIDRLERR